MNNDKLNEVIQKLEDGVQSVFTSDNYRKYLKFVSKFHNYSYSNTVLISIQKPNATLVAGFNTWQKDHKRIVQKGEKGISILAPVFVKKDVKQYKRDEKGEKIIDTVTGKVEMETVKKRHIYYKTISVFDISQTKGDPVPTLTKELKGTSDIAKALISGVREATEYTVYFAPDNFKGLETGAKGYCSPMTKSIVIKDSMSDIQKAKTIIHEYAHAELHSTFETDRNRAEVEAESIAFVLCEHFGLDTSDYSFPYIAAWNGKDNEKLKDILRGIQDKSSEFIDKLEPIIERRLERNKKKEKDIEREEI